MARGDSVHALLSANGVTVAHFPSFAPPTSHTFVLVYNLCLCMHTLHRKKERKKRKKEVAAYIRLLVQYVQFHFNSFHYALHFELHTSSLLGEPVSTLHVQMQRVSLSCGVDRRHQLTLTPSPPPPPPPPTPVHTASIQGDKRSNQTSKQTIN